MTISIEGPLIIISNIFLIIAWASFLAIALFYTSYFILLFSYYRKIKSAKTKLDFIYPTVSVIVPLYNEEKIIAKKIQNLNELVYPSEKIEVIFVDGNSTDKTVEILTEMSKTSQKPLTVIKQTKRNGYTKAVIEGISCSRGEIIIATDAASYHYHDALQHLVKHFADKKIGAVTGKEVVFGNSADLGPQLEKSYRSFYDFMRKAETVIDSTPDSKGEILAVRKEICLALFQKLNLSPNASFDSCVPYQAKLMGYRTIYDEEAKYYEYAPSSFSDRMTQQARRATVLIGAMVLYKNLLFNKNSGKFGLFILPVHFLMWCIFPSIFILGFVSLIVSTLLNPLAVIVLWIIILLLMVPTKSRYLLVSFTQSQFALVLALFRLLQRSESLFIKTIPSTRKQ